MNSLSVVRTGRIVHDNWKVLLIGQGFADHQWTETDGACCNLPRERHLEEMVDWNALPPDVQDEYDRIAHGDLEAAALVTNRTLGSTTKVRHMGTFRITGQAIISLLTLGRRCFEVLSSPIPDGATFVDIRQSSEIINDTVDGSSLELTIEHPSLPAVLLGLKAPYLDTPFICMQCNDE